MKMFCQSILLLIFSTALVWGNQLTEPEKDPLEIKFADLPPKVIWLDVRSKEKYADRHIPGAIHFDATRWNESLDKLFKIYEPKMIIVVYCDEGCKSSKDVATRLRFETGEKNIFYLHGGFDAFGKK